MIRRILTFLLPAVLAFSCLGAKAQTSSQNAPSLGLEVIFYPQQGPAYVAVKSSRGGSWFARYGHVPEWKQPADALPVTAVNIACEAAENGVRVWVSVYLGDKHEQEKPITSYILHEGEKVAVSELAEVGVVPFEIKVIRLSGLIGKPPTFVSKAKSIELVVMEPNLSSLPSYKVAVRNLSNRNVTAIRVQTLQNGKQQISGMPRGKDGAPLIAPHGIYEFDARLAVRSTPAAGEYSPLVLENQVIEISSAVFEDGSFEGDSETPVTLAVFGKGTKIQIARVISLLERCLSANDPEAFMNLDWLKAQVSALGIEADADAVAEVGKKLVGIPGTSPAELKRGIEIAMTGMRADVVKEITQFQIRSRRTDAEGIRNWLAATKERYTAWAGRL